MSSFVRDKWIPVTTERSVLRVAANILNKQLRTAEKGCSYRLGVRRGPYLLQKNILTQFQYK